MSKTFCLFLIIFVISMDLFLSRSSTSTSIECCDDINIELCDQLKNSVREYFTVYNLSMLIQKPHVRNLVTKCINLL